MKRIKEKPVKCIECGHAPVALKHQFRAPHPWAGKTGWRFFCNSGMHHAQVAIRAHKADAIHDWNEKQGLAQKLGVDPAKQIWNLPGEQGAEVAAEEQVRPSAGATP